MLRGCKDLIVSPDRRICESIALVTFLLHLCCINVTSRGLQSSSRYRISLGSAPFNDRRFLGGKLSEDSPTDKVSRGCALLSLFKRYARGKHQRGEGSRHHSRLGP